MRFTVDFELFRAWESPTPRYAITDYLRSLGCRDDELEPISDDTVAWRGAGYTAVEAKDAKQP
jgi:hypothetical protein